MIEQRLTHDQLRRLAIRVDWRYLASKNRRDRAVWRRVTAELQRRAALVGEVLKAAVQP